MLDEFLDRGDRFALAPQSLAEFVHTVTDPRRFQVPLTMETASVIPRNGGAPARWTKRCQMTMP